MNTGLGSTNKTMQNIFSTWYVLVLFVILAFLSISPFSLSMYEIGRLLPNGNETECSPTSR